MKGNVGICRQKGRIRYPLLLPVVLICALSVSLIFCSDDGDAAIGEVFTSGDIEYTVTGESPNKVTITGNSFTGSVLVIPSSVSHAGAEYAVTGIGNNAFVYSGLTSITIPDSVTSIGNYTFRGCTGLTSITIPNSVISIGDYAFRDCSGLTLFIIPNSVISIGNGTFFDCYGLISVTIPNSVTSIGNSAFFGCTNLISITMPDSITKIENYTFVNCFGLTSITIPNSVTTIGDNAFTSCSRLASITIPDSVTTIGARVFENCSGLTSITIPNSVTSIGNYAFLWCANLRIVAVPDALNIAVTGLQNKMIVWYSPSPGTPDIKFGVNAVIDASDVAVLTFVSDRADFKGFTDTNGNNFANPFPWPGNNVSILVDFAMKKVPEPSAFKVYKYPGEGTGISGGSTAKKNIDYHFTVSKISEYQGEPTVIVTIRGNSVEYKGIGTYTIKGADIIDDIVIRTSDLIRTDEIITINIEGKGIVMYSRDSGNSFMIYKDPIHVAEGVRIVIKAVPDDGNIFSEWRGVSSDWNSDTITVSNKDKTITAVFSPSDDDNVPGCKLFMILLIIIIIIICIIVVWKIRER
jgi:hypothetical protein